MLVLQPFVQADLGLMMFKPGKSLLSELVKMSQGNRVLIMPLPDELVNVPSGKLDRPVVNCHPRSALDSEELQSFFANSEVQRRLGNDFEFWLKRIPHCQLSDGDYCDSNLTICQKEQGALRICWHHDNQERAKPTVQAEAIAMRNLYIWATARIKVQLKLDARHSLSLPEIGWWSIKNRVFELLPSRVAEKLLAKRNCSRSVMVGGKRDTDDRFQKSPSDTVRELSKPLIEMLVDDQPPAMFMSRPKAITWQSEKYLKFVRSLPCVVTGQTENVVAHHLIGHGEGKLGGKAHDLFTMPLTADEHRRFHDDPKGWEARNGSQLYHVKQTIKTALNLGGLY
ncbi:MULTISPECIES: DUF968 domain-containing protein [unclassified Vibrio]|uniref:DUF968 domain-containing protein n=1 Tax=unclassified Vibrio TaxID=2614977 RepID=UPI001361E4F3|nr:MULTISPECIES: DUF968 domain-containing protein [unclassified Vibrio]NAW60106.1 DUF968 domain-containing protein [Vibrio sp. V36_P2S2PM302]NAX26729.1 DUF968 domain-containing protein [Vibrio sp. V38_P2S17PM301]NAX31818.1 DUF968 domain-containing protein [Vibrio sp. V37_P2S8PM304]